MKNQEILKKIREKRNEMFPDKCKLEFGCEIEITHILDENGKLYDFSKKLIHEMTMTEASLGVVDVINCGEEKMTILNNFGEIMEFNFDECRYRILGQPLDIADILRMLKNSTDPYLEVTSAHFLLIDEIIDEIKIDLSKPLKEQSEKVCEEIYNSIKKNYEKRN